MSVRARFRLFSLAIACLASAGLAGCADFHVGAPAVENAAQLVADAEWDKATQIKVDIRQDEFRPAIVRLYVGEAYILSFENRDDVSHTVSAPEFFATVAVRHIESGGAVSAENARVRGFSVAPGETKAIHVVPTLDGWYQFSDTSSGILFFTKAAVQGTVGSFIVAK